MRIGELARRTGIPTKTIRYYEARGLIAEPPRERSGYRRYDHDAVARLRFIVGAKQLGLTLGEIGDILGASEQQEVSCPHILALLETKRRNLERWIRGAKALSDMLEETIESSRQLMAGGSAAVDCCPVIERGLHARALVALEEVEDGLRAPWPFGEGSTGTRSFGGTRP